MLSRLREFKYLEPSTLSEVLSMLDQYRGKAKILAGGTDLIIQMKQKRILPEYIINLKKIPHLDYIEFDGKLLRIGPLVTHTDVSNSPIIKRDFDLLAEASLAVGVVQTRNRGTVGGNICNASPSADTPPALIALGAMLKIVSSNGERIIRIEDFFRGPFQTSLEENEIQIPNIPLNGSGVYLWLPKITAVDETLVGVGVLLVVNSERVCIESRVGLCSVGPHPIRAYKTEEFLKGKKIEDSLFRRAGEIASDEASPRSREEYRREMIRVFVRRALEQRLLRRLNLRCKSVHKEVFR